MKTLALTQGSAAWHQARATHNTASEAPAMMGVSRYQSRNALLRQKATGLTEEIDEETQRRFDAGHATEERARAIVEKMIGEELFPATGTDDEGRLLASFDGITLLSDVIYEHKLWNEDLAAQVRAGELDPMYYWQLEQQLLVSEADRCIFVTSDGTREHFESMEYTAQPGRAAQLIAGWKQFDADLAEWTPETAHVEAVGRAPESLPALRIEVTGMVTASNLADFKANAMTVLGSINTVLTTDEHFADAEKTVKWCKGVEERLEAAKEHALSQTATIDELFRTIDAIAAETRAKRLALDKLVAARKSEIRLEIATAGKQAIDAHIAKLNERVHPARLLSPVYSINDAMKGKRTLTSLRGAVDDEVARVKIATNAQADTIDANIRAIREKAPDHQFLFADLQSLVLKPVDDLLTLIGARVSEHDRKEAEKLEKERERIRDEERKRAAEQAQAAAPPAVPAPATSASAAEPAPVATTAGRRSARGVSRTPARPGDSEIVDVLVRHYTVQRATVISWLSTIDLKKAA